MKRRGFLQVLFSTPAVASISAVARTPVEERKTFLRPQKKFGFVRISEDVKQGEKLFCSRRDEKTIDACPAGNGEFHALALHDVNWADLDTGSKGPVPLQLTVAVRFI